MGIVNIAESEKTPKPVVYFGSAIDLAHGLIREWIDSNQELRRECDKAFQFFFNTLGSPIKRRNKIERYFYKREIKKHRKNLNLLIVDLRFINDEIDNLIGHSAYLREGSKMKIKNKKQFDDALIEYKEITIMLLGISMFLSYDNEVDGNFIAEKEILKQIRPTGLIGYYQNMYAKVGRHQFK